MLADIAALVGRRPPRISIPWRAAMPIAAASEAIAWVTGREPLATMDGVRLAKYRMFFTPAKAAQELGFTTRPYREGLRDAVQWFAETGQLPRRLFAAGVPKPAG